MARVFSYVMTSDTGFAPHVADGVLTLATCKPSIRRLASEKEGDYIMGIRGFTLARKSKTPAKRMVFLAMVSEKMGFYSYYNEKTFKGRKGNIYHKVDGRWVQDRNCYHKHTDRKTDLKAPVLLISRKFLYSGKGAVRLEPELFNSFVRMGRTYRQTVLDEDGRRKVESLFEKYKLYLNETASPSETR